MSNYHFFTGFFKVVKTPIIFFIFFVLLNGPVFKVDEIFDSLTLIFSNFYLELV